MKMRKENQEIAKPESEIVKKVTEHLERAIGRVPSTKETTADDPEARCRIGFPAWEKTGRYSLKRRC